MPIKFNTKPKNEMTLNKNINKNTRKSNLTYQNNVSIQQNINTIPTTNNKKLIPSKKSKSRIHAKSLSMSNIQLIENNSYINSTSSHEKSPSELRTPKTISEDSFTKENKENIKVKINKTIKTQKKKLINNSHNIKLRLNNQNLFGFIPSIQKSILVKKNKILNSNDKSRSKYEEKTEPIHQLKKNFSHHFINFYLNKKIENKKGIKKNKNKIPINNKYKKDNIKDIIRTENIYKNKIKKKGKIFFKLDKKLSKDFDIDNTSINNRI